MVLLSGRTFPAYQRADSLDENAIAAQECPACLKKYIPSLC